MDPLSIQMTMGSPRMLRGRVSLSTLVGRKKESPGSDKSAPLKTPKRLKKIDENLPSTPSKLPSTSRRNTVLMRRGFRPLSVVTNLTPFEADALKAMEEIQERDGTTTTEDQFAKTSLATIEQSPDTSPAGSPQSLGALPLANKSEISLRAFLAQTSPPSPEQEEVLAPFSTLYQIPVPDIRQHPAFSPNPFSSRSDAPTLSTSSSGEEIKKFVRSARKSGSHSTDRSSASSDLFGTPERKMFKLLDRLHSPSSILNLNRTSSISADMSPLAKRQPKSRPIEIPYKPLDHLDEDLAKKRNGSGGIRKFSDVFKSKPSMERQSSHSTIADNDGSETVKEQMEKYLRRVTCSPTYPYADSSYLPPHPHTGRFWRSRNLKCTACTDVCCACCGRTCCAFKAAVMALETHKDNPEGRQAAVERIQQITMVFPYGRESPTFLLCTNGYGNGTGCGKLVCPDCCGVCPDEACGDIQCRKCKKDPWVECSWHSHVTRSSIGENVSIRHTV